MTVSALSPPTARRRPVTAPTSRHRYQRSDLGLAGATSVTGPRELAASLMELQTTPLWYAPWQKDKSKLISPSLLQFHACISSPCRPHIFLYSASVVAFAAANGSVLWYMSLASQTVLPLVSYSGQSVVSDGRTLAWLARDGRSLAPPVRMYPVQGELFDLTITLSTSIVTMVYRCGFIATFTVGV